MDDIVANLATLSGDHPIWTSAVLVLLVVVIAPRVLGKVWRVLRSQEAFHARARWDGKSNPDARTLLLTAHGWAINRGFFDRAARYIRDSLAAADPSRPIDLLRIRYPGNVFSDEEPSDLAKQIRLLIARECAGRNYERIILFTHSSGTLLLRQAYLEDRADVSARDVNELKWWPLVNRFVQASGVNGGFNRDLSFLIRGSVYFGQVIGRGKFALRCERGKPFIENMRAAWLDECRAAEVSGAAMPIMVQMVATREHLLDDLNNVDVASTPHYYALEVPGSGHVSVLYIGLKMWEERDPWRTRREMLALAATGSPDQLAAAAKETAYRPDPAHARITDIVLVAHGIRDRGHWARLFADAIEAEEGGGWAVVTDRFARASAFTLMFGNRDKNARWFADCYIRARALYPCAERVHFIGHSYGTYVMGAALSYYRKLRFERAYFAGSVLPRDFDWADKIQRGQVKTIMNACASSDYIVACFPGFYDWVRRNVPILRHWRRLHIGDAGFAGFDQLNRREVAFLRGGHGAFVEWPEAVEVAKRFILHGDSRIDYEGARWVNTRPDSVAQWANTMVPIVWLLFGLSLAVIASSVVQYIPGQPALWSWQAMQIGLGDWSLAAMLPHFAFERVPDVTWVGWVATVGGVWGTVRTLMALA